LIPLKNSRHQPKKQKITIQNFINKQLQHYKSKDEKMNVTLQIMGFEPFSTLPNSWAYLS
jgi:hypothetical protein